MGRGAGPRDKKLFAMSHWSALSAAVLDLGFLLERRYAEAAALKLVGDHYQLYKRQRLAVQRCAAGPSQIALRTSRQIHEIAGKTLEIDGFNLVILLEAAIGGGVVFGCADGTYRDLSSVHGTYRTVEQTEEVILWVGEWCAAHEIASVRWLFDAPVSNSGKLAALVRQIAEKYGWSWNVETTPFVDRALCVSENVVVSSDKIILERCQRWTNLGQMMLDEAYAADKLPALWLIDLPQAQERGILERMAGALSF